MIGGVTMSEKSDKLRAMLEKEKERRIKLNNRIEILERRIPANCISVVWSASVWN